MDARSRITLRRELVAKVTARADRIDLSNAALIGIADAAGFRDLAIRYAERAWAEREPQFILELPLVRADPRLQAILRELDAEGRAENPGPS